jgi:hypothetical protein
MDNGSIGKEEFSKITGKLAAFQDKEAISKKALKLVFSGYPELLKALNKEKNQFLSQKETELATRQFLQVPPPPP